MYETITMAVENRIATITLNRPEESNAFVANSYTEIQAALAECSGNPDVAVVVLTGKGKNFSAGGNIGNFKKLITSQTYIKTEGVETAGRMAMAVRKCTKPVIAMVNGAAAGAGAGLALACDFRIMTPKSKLIMAFVNLGLTGDTLSFYHLVKMIGTARAGEIMMTGDPVTGEAAFTYGLATQLVPVEELETATYAFAAKMAAKATAAIATQKEMLNQVFFSDAEEFVKLEAVNMRAASMSEDFETAVDAFLEKKVPVFKGK